MEFAAAFRETLHHFKIKGEQVAQKSGLPASRISAFRNGTNVRSQNIERILDALPPEAKLYWLHLVLFDKPPGDKPWVKTEPPA
jgi:predicted transcriptional regulator